VLPIQKPPSSKPEPQLHPIIDTSAKLTELVKQLQACTDPAAPVAWDTETTDLEPRDAQLVELAVVGDPTEVAYIPLGHTDGGNLNTATVLDTCAPSWKVLTIRSVAKCQV